MKFSGQKIIVVGKKGTGKTGYLEILNRIYRNKGREVGGFLSLNKHHGSKDNYHLVALQDDQTWILASRNRQDQFSIQYGDYYFNPTVFEIGNKILQNSVDCTAIIVDEYGPLERDQKGFYKGIRFLLNNYSGTLIIATRPATLDSLKQLILSSGNNLKPGKKSRYIHE
jgi:nucleoside-triphosphatase THEP1